MKVIKKKAFVIPAFEMIDTTTIHVPNTKSELLSLIQIGNIQIFRQNIWNQGHAAMDFNKWKNSNEPYLVG